MFDGKVCLVTEAVGRVFDRKIAIGIALGVSAMFAGYAVSAVSSSSGSTLVNANSTLISQQSSVVAQGIMAAAEDCNENGIGKAIDDALNIHLELASAMPDVESLFDPSNSCFSGLSQIYDLSFAIPSLSSIIGAASDAVMQYAQKTVCSAVNQVTGLATGTINDAINQVNQMGSGLLQIDPFIGSGYSSSSGGSYTVGTNPFNGTQAGFDSAQTDFGGTTGTSGSGNGGGSMDSTNAQINGFNQQIANVQAQIGPAQYQLQQAQRDLSNCQSQGYNNCTSYQLAVDSAQGTLNSLNAQLTSLQGQLSNVSPSSYRTQSASTTSNASGNSSFIQSIGGLFN